jgi:excinuclease ABC subunit A
MFHFARIGKPYCIACGHEIKKLSNEEILDTIMHLVKEIVSGEKGEKVLGVGVTKGKILIAAPVVVGRKGEYYQLLYDMLGRGFERALIDGKLVSLRDRIELSRTHTHNIDIVIDEFFVSEFADDPKGVRERVS